MKSKTISLAIATLCLLSSIGCVAFQKASDFNCPGKDNDQRAQEWNECFREAKTHFPTFMHSAQVPHLARLTEECMVRRGCQFVGVAPIPREETSK